MPTLDTVLTLKNLEKISSLASQFGFKDVRVAKPFADMKGKLYLIAAEKEDEDQYRSALEATLMNKLHCKVELIVEDEIESFYKDAAKENSAHIADPESVYQLFDNKLAIVEVEPPIKDINFTRAMQLANRVLKEKEQAKQYSDASIHILSEKPALSESKTSDKARKSM